jgi:YidC/Oxa1 family membrane protein insertase
MEERRLLLAVALSLLVLTAYQLLFPSRPVPRVVAPSPSPSAPVARSTPSPPEPRAATVVPAVSDERERRVEVEGPDVVAAFTNRGARLVSWRLMRFADARGRPEEMVESAVGGPRPLDLTSGDDAVDERLREALFRPSTETLTLSGPGEQTLVFEFAEAGLSARKVLRFRSPGYVISISAEVAREGQRVPVKVLWGPGVGNPTAAEKEVQGYQPPQAVALVAGAVERFPAEKIGASRTLASVAWVGVESHYFAALLVPPELGGPAEIRGVTVPGEGEARRVAPQAAVALPSADAAALLYVGPKDYPALARLGHSLARVVPIGDWIGPIVVALMRLLSWVHGHVGNYGWAIIVVTIIINLAMAPLRHYSIANSAKMAKLAPEMKVIQDRYRKVPALDPKRQEMQKEVAALYERHGMSMGTQMAVGCLPMLLTMPFLFAIYRVLQVSIQLRGADFLWIPDLSHRDPLFLTPLFMGASMFLMQRLTPSTMDPAQQRIMTIMPIVFTVMFFAAPAGLNLYWLTANVCSILQQAVTLRLVRARGADGGSKDRRRR